MNENQAQEQSNGDISIKPASTSENSVNSNASVSSQQEQKVEVVEQKTLQTVKIPQKPQNTFQEEKKTISQPAAKLNLPEKEESLPAKAGFLKTIVFLILGLAIVSGNFFIEHKVASSDTEEKLVEFQGFSDSGDNMVPHNGLVRLDKSGAVPTITTERAKLPEYLFHLQDGRIWGNFELSDSKVNFLAGKAVIIPDHAAFDLEYDDNGFVLRVFRGDVYVGFLDEGIKLPRVVDQYNPSFINEVLVPQGTRISVPDRKVNQRLVTLLYSKLVKEVKLSTISKDENAEEWVKGNLRADTEFAETLKQERVAGIFEKGSEVSDGLFENFISFMEESLTFIPEKKSGKDFNRVFDYLNDAVYYAQNDEEAKVIQNLADFQLLSSELPQVVREGDDYQARIDEQIDSLRVFGPRDSAYNVYLKLLDQKFASNPYDYEVVNMLWLDVYDGIAESESTAAESLGRYFSYLKKSIGKYESLDYYRSFITFQNQLFDNLFLRFDNFYRDDYFEMKYALEKEILSLYEDENLKRELSQDLINNKITFLKRLIDLFFEDKIEINEARDIVSRLIREIREFMPPETSNVAVLDLFEERLNEIGSFYQYLQTPEYYASSTYGRSNREKYETYLDERENIWTYIQVEKDLLGEESDLQEMTVRDVNREVRAVIDASGVIGDYTVGEISDTTVRKVDVEGKIGEYPFKAEYDRDLKKFVNVYVLEKLITDRPVKIESLPDLIDKIFDKYEEDNLAGPLTEETNAQRLLKRYLVGQLNEVGFKVDEGNVSLSDPEKSIYIVDGAVLEAAKNYEVSFEFLVNGEKARKVTISYGDKSDLQPGEYSLDQLVELVLSVEARS